MSITTFIWFCTSALSDEGFVMASLAASVASWPASRLKSFPVGPDRIRGRSVKSVVLAGPGGEELWQALGVALNDRRSLGDIPIIRGIASMMVDVFHRVRHLARERTPHLDDLLARRRERAPAPISTARTATAGVAGIMVIVRATRPL